MDKLMNEKVLQGWAQEIALRVEGDIKRHFRLGMFFLVMAVLTLAFDYFLILTESSRAAILSVLVVVCVLVAATGLNFSAYDRWVMFKARNCQQPQPREEVKMNEYRQDVNEAVGDASWTLRRILPLLLGVLLVMVLIGWVLQSTGIISMNIDREVTQHSRQYTESKQAMLQTLYTEYANLQTKAAEAEASGQANVAEAVKAQQMAILSQMRREATNIPQSELPVEVGRLIR